MEIYAYTLVKNKILSTTINQKGQGIVEYTLVMSFIVILSVVIFTSDYCDDVKKIFDNVVVALLK